MVKLFSSYHNKLIFLILVLSLIPIIIITSYLYIDKISTQEKILKDEMISSSENGANNVGMWIEERKNNIQSIANNQEIITATKQLLDPNIGNEELFAARLSLEKQLNIAFHNYNWLDEIIINNPKTGYVIFYTGITPPKISFNDEKYFQDAIAKKIGMSDIYASAEIIKNEYGKYEQGVPTLLISVPIAGEVGLEGVLSARVNVFKMDTKASISSKFTSIDGFLINSDGYFISKPAFVKEALDSNLMAKRAELELRANGLNSKEFHAYQESDNHGTVWNVNGFNNYVGNFVIGSVTSVKGTNWSYVTQINKDDAYSDIHKLQIMLLSSIGLIVAVICMTSILFANNLLNPIKELTKTMENAIDENGVINLIKNFDSSINENNEISKLYVTFSRLMNITKKSIQNLKLAENKFRTLYDEMPDLCRTINDEGVILDCNKVYARSLGYSREEIIGTSIFDHVDKSHLAAIHDSFETWKKTGLVTNREIWLKRKDGSIFPALISATNLYDENGKRIGSNSVIKDMTETYSAKKELEDLYNENPDLLSTVNPEGIVLNCNKTHAAILGYTREELIGKSIFNYVADKSIENAMSLFSSFIANGKIRDNEIWIKKRDGSNFPCLISANGRFDENGKLTEGVFTIKDISDLYNTRKILHEKEKQITISEEKAKNSRLIAIGETASRLGHDLRNPLSIIMNTFAILKLKSKNVVLDESILKKYDIIERAISRMSHQIEDVLDFVRIKPLELGSHSLVEIIKGLSDKITKPVNVKINLPQNDLKITCDSKKLEIVFINIITNAVQAMGDKGEITIKITDDKDNSCISIENSGPGIPDEILSKIFDPLFTTKQTGTGLGLVSSKNIVEQHGGSITVKNNPTTFTILLPMNPTENSEVRINPHIGDEPYNIQLMRYYEEALAQAARNYAFTGDKKWEQRYRILEPASDKLLKKAIKNADKKDKAFFLVMDKANHDLVEIETAALELVNNGQASKAVKILESNEYERQRKILRDGLAEQANAIESNELNQTSQ
ncbi:MAG: PAS domain S-box protein [Thaumarchaeota archaeon]|nr:PAS domain S-box protein [Nitrososphaerota archaeon]MBI3639170.1 PAS domain S-box protein [Nitrososphaerota archaeon]